ncbi:MAG: sugar phosphate isomerase/epimerase [Clostridia bacterium]|nr:sugar phosphate isomerase/epimerase [Clostridia bacterium]
MIVEKIGLQLYSVRENFKTEEQARATFKKLKELGFDEVQTAGCYDFSYDKFYEMANDAGLEIVGTHDNLQMMVDDIEKAIDNHKKLHTTNMGVGGFFPQKLDVAEVEAFIEKANKIAARIAKEGMKFTYHNHSHEFVVLENGKSVMEMLIEGLDPENTSFVLDSYWVQNAGGDVCTWIEKLKGRIDILHLKDMAVRFNENRETISYITEVGNGNLDFKKIIETAKKCGVKYFCVEQDDCPVDFEASMKQASDYLHNL